MGRAGQGRPGVRFSEMFTGLIMAGGRGQRRVAQWRHAPFWRRVRVRPAGCRGPWARGQLTDEVILTDLTGSGMHGVVQGSLP
jgi:hypothetical protein